MFTILHISDLHRSTEEPVANASLIASLLADADRYAGETPRVPPPAAIVVSGDVIQGVPIGKPEWEMVMTDQYRIASRFLAELCDRFVDGDRGRVIVVPGNHDVCWNSSFGAMERVPTDAYPADISSVLSEPESNYRWSWKDRALYKIADVARYAKRMDFYWNFVETFYADVELPIPIDRSRGFQHFEICDGRVAVAAFDSTAGNDCFSYSGAIPREVVAKSALAFRDAGRAYDIRAAVWHHSVQGPPIRSDYMDVSAVHEMIGFGFQLGLHGHQHVAAVQTQLIHLDETQSMAVVSAGSLCAGAKDLPRGTNRQYNLIVLEDEMSRARVHAREMGEGEQFSRKRDGEFLEGFVVVGWQTPRDVAGRMVNAHSANARRAVLDAEEALRSGNPSDALTCLANVNLSAESYARRLAIEALQAIRDWPGLIKLLQPPLRSEESIALVSALTNEGSLNAAQAVLDEQRTIDPGSRRGLQDILDAKKLMRPR